MKIPKKLKIGAHEYKVTIVGAIEEFGLCKPKNLEIFISEDAPKSQQEETLIHEALHAIVDQLRLFHMSEGDKEEKLVQRMGHAIYQLLIDNKLLK